MSTQNDLGRATARGRELAWEAAAFLLIALGIGSIALALARLISGGGGVAFLPLAVPPLVAGYAVLRRMRWSRSLGFVVAVAYSSVVAYVATTPWRGLTPPLGQNGSAIDPSSVVVAIAFLVAAAMVVVGRAEDRARSR